MSNFDKKTLKDLKKQLAEKNRDEKEATQKRLKQQVEDQYDQNFFSDAMQGVTPLKDDKAYHEVERPKAKVRPADEDFEELFIHDPLSDELEVEDVQMEGVLSFCREGIQNNVFKKLRSGNYRISDELDLHGSSIKQAKMILVYYLQEAVQFEGCCIRIVHGKGNRSGDKKPVLKTQVNHWLSEHERVLAFHSCKPKDGGTGAVYVLLKR
ncbi:Smr/MutS family protein [Cocleimonas flava]|uniref:DNA-nicking Smr family endonuclease n=1 Tax=Cocleimonas flava TaxID=634765 RepID=A0A4R1ET22_9GAMM|nr:Smr/MutS family protein [Cocleimonas flava]TCJ82934.1 DNA-nicking Smr family endonuclease [Cocleimonas flava]